MGVSCSTLSLTRLVFVFSFCDEFVAESILSSTDSVTMRFIPAINPSSVSFRLLDFIQNWLNSGMKRIGRLDAGVWVWKRTNFGGPSIRCKIGPVSQQTAVFRAALRSECGLCEVCESSNCN
jgi:hypothetical protein